MYMTLIDAGFQRASISLCGEIEGIREAWGGFHTFSASMIPRLVSPSGRK
jgi:hypothetical protein